MPPLPKDPKTRQRRNKETTAAQLGASKMVENHDLPPRELIQADGAWHPMTVKWWRDVWDSPMREEYVQADTHSLYQLAVLVDMFWKAEKLRDALVLAAEIRMSGQRFGLTPLDRRRLQWTVATTEEATAKAERTKAGRAPESAPVPVKDPRRFLRAVDG